MTRVLSSAQPAEVADDGERDQVARSLPRTPVVTRAHATRALKIVPPIQEEVDWEAFVAAYFPGSRRHDLKAIRAYGAYKRSRGVGEQSTAGGTGSKGAKRISTRAASIEAWEDEGGAAR
jgi:hypothetical protein